MSNSSNRSYSSASSVPSLGRDENLAKVEVGILGAILFLAIFGNAVVLSIICVRRKKLSRMHILIAHLSLADLFVAFFEVLPQLIWDITFRFYGNNFTCKTVKYFQLVAMYGSSFVLVSTAIDRYIAIVHPLTSHTWTTRRVHLLVGLSWVLSLLFAMPQLFLFAMREVSPGSGQYDCWENMNYDWEVKTYITWITVSIYIVPLCILCFAYGRICFVVWKSAKLKEGSQKQRKQSRSLVDKTPTESKVEFLDSSNNASFNTTTCSKKHAFSPRAHARSLSTAKVKTVKMTLSVIICYLVCWSPFFVAQMWSAWDSSAPFTGECLTSGRWMRRVETKYRGNTKISRRDGCLNHSNV